MHFHHSNCYCEQCVEAEECQERYNEIIEAFVNHGEIISSEPQGDGWYRIEIMVLYNGVEYCTMANAQYPDEFHDVGEYDITVI
jgi:hypothetical protein